MLAAVRVADLGCRKDQFVMNAVEVAEAATAAGIPNLEKTGNSFPAFFDIEKIQDILPHR